MSVPLRPVRVIATGSYAWRLLDDIRRAGGEVLDAYQSGRTVVALVRPSVEVPR